MANCTATINNLIASGAISGVTEIRPNTLTPFSLTQTSPVVLMVDSSSTQTANFTISGQSSAGAGSPVNMVATVYSFTSGAATVIGSVNITSANSSFQKDFQAGEYLICISSSNAAGFTGTIIGQFQAFPSVASLIVTMRSGEMMTEEFYVPPANRAPCDKTIYYEIVDGELPPGITMLINGDLQGVFPNLDCLPGPPVYSPAVNWFYEHGGTNSPVGRQWRFQVKIWLPDFPAAVAYRWFCIRIYNDWSLDRDNFMKQPKTKTVELKIINDPPALPKSVCVECPIPVTAIPTFTSIPELCAACTDPNADAINAQSLPTDVTTAIIEQTELNTRGPGDLDALFLEWGDIINQTNPIFTEAYDGTVFTADVKTNEAV